MQSLSWPLNEDQLIKPVFIGDEATDDDKKKKLKDTGNRRILDLNVDSRILKLPAFYDELCESCKFHLKAHMQSHKVNGKNKSYDCGLVL